MDTYSSEKLLAFFYPLIIFMSILCCITSGIAWVHWRHVLNACPITNCGCFLNGHSTYNEFEGGHIAYCHFATYGLILPLFFAVILGIYHVYRVCMGTGKRKQGVTTLRQRSGDMIVVTTESEMTNNGISPYYWTPAAVISCVMFLYTLVHASIFTDGYKTTCEQYRLTLLKELQGVGHIVGIIKGRLSCGSVFDFMDFLVRSDRYERRRYGQIHTATCLYFALIGTWMAVFAWLCISIINIVQSRRSKHARM